MTPPDRLPPDVSVPPRAPAYPPPARKKGMPAWAIVLIAVGGIVALVCVLGVAFFALGLKGVSDSQTAARGDVTITSCSADSSRYDLLGPTATVQVVNHGSRKATYTVTVQFVSDDGTEQLGTGLATVNDLDPGQSAEKDAVSFARGKAAAGFRCQISKVNRF